MVIFRAGQAPLAMQGEGSLQEKAGGSSSACGPKKV